MLRSQLIKQDTHAYPISKRLTQPPVWIIGTSAEAIGSTADAIIDDAKLSSQTNLATDSILS